MSTKISLKYWHNGHLGFHLFHEVFDDEETGPIYLELTGCDFQADSAQKTLVVNLPRQLAMELHLPQNFLLDDKCAITAGTIEPVSKYNEIDRLRRECAEAYQVVATLATAAGVFNTEAVIGVLDNLSAAAEGAPRQHGDVLPFACDDGGDDELAARRRKLMEWMRSEIRSWDADDISAMEELRDLFDGSR